MAVAPTRLVRLTIRRPARIVRYSDDDFKASLATALFAGGVTLLADGPAEAQDYQAGSSSLHSPSSSPSKGTDQPRRSAQRLRALAAKKMLRSCRSTKPFKARDLATRPAAPAGSPSGRPDAQCALHGGRLQLDVGTNTQNLQVQAQAVDAMLASGAAPPSDDSPSQRAVAIHDPGEQFAGAEAPLTRLVEPRAHNVERITLLARSRLMKNKRQERAHSFSVRCNSARRRPDAERGSLSTGPGFSYESREGAPTSSTLGTLYAPIQRQPTGAIRCSSTGNRRRLDARWSSMSAAHARAPTRS